LGETCLRKKNVCGRKARGFQKSRKVERGSTRKGKLALLRTIKNRGCEKKTLLKKRKKKSTGLGTPFPKQSTKKNRPGIEIKPVIG